MGTLSIPRLDLSAVVFHGTDTQTLRRGPGHLEHTALPGDSGNVVIAGHRDSFFWPLRNIQLGDEILIDTPEGRFRYRVASVRVVNPREVSVLAATDEPVLTLITCYPFWVFGNAPDRLVVRATAVVSATTVAIAFEEASSQNSMASASVKGAHPQEITDSDGTLVNDDQVLVRLAVERYRLMYNGRLMSRNEVGPAGLLKFETCDVTVTSDHATAVCGSGLSPSSASESTGRTFMLERVASGWAIRSIVVK